MVTLDPDLEQAQQGGRVSLHVVGSYIIIYWNVNISFLIGLWQKTTEIITICQLYYAGNIILSRIILHILIFKKISAVQSILKNNEIIPLHLYS
jgi:hypothetical protein